MTDEHADRTRSPLVDDLAVAATAAAVAAGLTAAQTAWFRSEVAFRASSGERPGSAELEAEALLEAGRIDFAEYRRRLGI